MTTASTGEQRSAFVTAVAWIFIGLAGFTTLIALLQNVMLSIMLTPAELQAPMRQTGDTQDIPAFAKVMFDHPRLIFGLFLILSALTLVSAIGLLKRRNWARLLFLGILVLGILWNLGSMVLPFYMFSQFVPTMPAHTPQDIRDSFDLTWKVMTAFTIIMALLFAGLFGWIAKRLVSRDIKQEFVAI